MAWQGNSIGTQAHDINTMITGSRSFTIDEIYEALVRKYPTTTRGRVSSHIRALRTDGAPLVEVKQGRILYVRLKPPVPLVEDIPPVRGATIAAERVPESPPLAADLDAPPASRVQTTVSRVVRDTELTNWVKRQHGYRCQLCDETIRLADGSGYAEGHHLRPLGKPHDGPDVAENIVCLCPNHHATCDLGAIRLKLHLLRPAEGHAVGERFVAYHNEAIFRG